MFALLLSGCTSVLGIEDLHTPTPVINGFVREIGVDHRPVANAAITLRRDAGSVQLGEATTHSDGSFDMAVAEGFPSDGFFEIMDPRYLHTFSYVLRPDLSVELVTLTAAQLQSLASTSGTTQNQSNWLVIAEVVDGDGGPVSGATVSSEPTAPPQDLCYSDAITQLPCHAGSTTGDGRAWFFDAPEQNNLMINAVDAQQLRYDASIPLVPGPGVVFTPLRPSA